ncbi:MAG: DinB family protein [Oscillochloridaceae bacterium umkhey_bin13]
MITPAYLASCFSRNLWIIKQQTAGLSHGDSLVQLPFRANCMNWILGHLIVNRNLIFNLLGAEPILDPDAVIRYDRETEPIISDEPGVLPLEQLLATFEQSQAHLETILSTLTPNELERQVALFGRRSMSVAEWLLFLYFHETYHTGQTEIMRQAAGKDDKVL